MFPAMMGGPAPKVRDWVRGLSRRFETGRGQGSVDRPLRHPEALGDSLPGHSLSGQISHHVPLVPGIWLPALVLPFALGLGDLLTLTFQHDLSLKLGNRSHEVQHQFPGCCPGIQAKVEDAKADPLGLQGCDNLAKVQNASGQTIQLRHDQSIPFPQVVQASRKLRSLCNAADLFAEDPGAARLLQLPKLGFKARLLFDGRGSGIADNCRHGVSPYDNGV